MVNPALHLFPQRGQVREAQQKLEGHNKIGVQYPLMPLRGYAPGKSD